MRSSGHIQNRTKLALTVLLTFTIGNLFGQTDGVSIDYSGTPTREPKAIFQTNSTQQGVILPRMTAAQRVAIAPPTSAKGMTVYQTDATEGYFYWDGTQWLRLMSTTGTGSITVTPSGVGLSVTGSPVSLGGTVTITSNATSSNTANTIVSRDGSGNFSAGLITANFDGEWRAKDDRIIEPNSITSRYAKFGFTSYNNNNTAPYADYLHLRSYGDATGGNDNLVMFAKNQIAMRVYQHTFNSATPYSNYKTVAFVEDLSNFSGLASPSATIGLTAINGSATTALRSDAAPALSQAIVPTWTGTHTFNNGTYSALFTGGNVGIGTPTPAQKLHVAGEAGISGLAGAGNDLVYANSSGDLVRSTYDISTTPQGTGTLNYLARWTSTTALGTGATRDDGTNVGIGVAPGTYKLNVNGTGRFANTLTTAAPSIYAAVTDLGYNAPIAVPQVNTASGGFAPVLQATTVITGGYRKHINIGSYRTGSGWGGGIYLAQGGSDNYPTEYFLLGYGGAIDHSSGNITTSGNVGIGTAPSAQLHTTGSVRFAGVGATGTNTQILTRDGSGNLARIIHRTQRSSSFRSQVFNCWVIEKTMDVPCRFC